MKRLVVFRILASLMTIVGVARIACRTRAIKPAMRVSRGALLKLGGLGVTALVTGAWKNFSVVLAAPVKRGILARTCLLSPEQTEGPYYIPKEKVRSNITEHRPGTPLQLRLVVIDAATCKPIKGAAVDIWHCDAGGVYSGFESASAGGPPGGGSGPTDRHTYLRGIQRTNARGLARFQTIYPGWYRGRTVHIHVTVHVGGALIGHVAHTGQLYFPDSLTGRVYGKAPYKARSSARDTFNATDSIYGSGGRQSTLSLKGDGNGGYIGTITLGVRHSA